MINELFRKGAEVVYERLAEIHVSGHACQEELKTILALTKPRYFMPVHGEYRHLKVHADLAKQFDIPAKNIFISEIGRTLEITKNTAKLTTTVPSGRVLVDGLGVGDVGTAVLRDRKHLAEDGLIVVVVTMQEGVVVAGPDIISRGFVYVRESEDMIGNLRKVVQKSLESCEEKNIRDWATIKSRIKDDVSDHLYKVTKRSPMILPVIMEI